MRPALINLAESLGALLNSIGELAIFAAVLVALVRETLPIGSFERRAVYAGAWIGAFGALLKFTGRIA